MPICEILSHNHCTTAVYKNQHAQSNNRLKSILNDNKFLHQPQFFIPHFPCDVARASFAGSILPLSSYFPAPANLA